MQSDKARGTCLLWQSKGGVRHVFHVRLGSQFCQMRREGNGVAGKVRKLPITCCHMGYMSAKPNTDRRLCIFPSWPAATCSRITAWDHAKGAGLEKVFSSSSDQCVICFIYFSRDRVSEGFFLIVGVCQRFSMRPTLKKYFGVGPGSEIIFLK